MKKITVFSFSMFPSIKNLTFIMIKNSAFQSSGLCGDLAESLYFYADIRSPKLLAMYYF